MSVKEFILPEDGPHFRPNFEISVSKPSEKQTWWKQMKTEGFIVVNLLKTVSF